jgi:hypothetical protein
MAYDAFIGLDESGKEVWSDYLWLRNGCTDDIYFNWMYGLWTAQNPDIKSLLYEIHRLPYIVELPGDEKRFVLETI